jgi:ATP-dependent protease HslVU (ClpYQ) ATPase subunit
MLILQPERFVNLGIDPPKGVMLYGPPGTGKTLCARAVANRTDATFIRVIGSELVQKYADPSFVVKQIDMWVKEREWSENYLKWRVQRKLVLYSLMKSMPSAELDSMTAQAVTMKSNEQCSSSSPNSTDLILEETLKSCSPPIDQVPWIPLYFDPVELTERWNSVFQTLKVELTF